MVIIAYLLLFLMFITMYYSIKYASPFIFILILGKKRCGKTTDIVKLSMKYRKKGWTCYSTEYIPGTYYIEPEDIGFYELDRKSVLFIDEIGIVWHKRDFKSFKKEVREWFKLGGHRWIRIYAYSQSYDIDASLREICDEIWIAKKLFGCITMKRKILKNLGIVEATGESESRIVENLKLLPLIVPGSTKFTWIPKYARYFDSFSAPELKRKDFEYLPEKVFKLHFRPQLRLMRMELKRIAMAAHTKYLTFRYKKGWIRNL